MSQADVSHRRHCFWYGAQMKKKSLKILTFLVWLYHGRLFFIIDNEHTNIYHTAGQIYYSYSALRVCNNRIAVNIRVANKKVQKIPVPYSKGLYSPQRPCSNTSSSGFIKYFPTEKIQKIILLCLSVLHSIYNLLLCKLHRTHLFLPAKQMELNEQKIPTHQWEHNTQSECPR